MTQKELREQNRAAVIRAAQGRFLAQSIDKTTIAEIAEDADLTPMSVYRYFGSKQAIAVAVANHLLDAYLAEHSARCEAARSGAPENGYETFSRVLGAYIDTYEAHPEYIRFLQDMAFYALREQLPESVRYMCFSRPVATGLDKPGREALVRGMEDGSVRRDLDLEMVYLNLVNLLTGGVNFRILIDEATQMKIIRSSAEILLYYVKNSGR